MHRQGHVGALGAEPLFERSATEPACRLGKRCVDLVFGGVQLCAGAAPRFRIEPAQFAHREGQRSAPSEIFDADFFETVRRRRRFDLPAWRH